MCLYIYIHARIYIGICIYSIIDRWVCIHITLLFGIYQLVCYNLYYSLNNHYFSLVPRVPAGPKYRSAGR